MAVPGQAAGSEIHGENGDDFLFGGAGNDVLFGDAQNDVIVGGYGNDWMSGGTGEDGMLGDDGRIFVSRVSSSFGEPLYGIAATPAASLGQLISTPGTMQEALINVAGTLRYTAVLAPDNLDPSLVPPGTNTPRPVYANDVMYGGLGDDALHGGAGDDAMTGAEALPVSYANDYNIDAGAFPGTPLNLALTIPGSLVKPRLETDFNHPFNPGNLLGYSPESTFQEQYDPNDPFREITLTSTGALDKTATGSGLQWFLNFDSTAGPLDGTAATTTGNWCGNGTISTCVKTDGNDAIFGDQGNDWLVGGTGRDTMYGGWGNDYLNADDKLDTCNGTTGSCVTNIGTDTNPSYEDMAYGGAGRDVLLANTGGDRLIDWSGEFDSYLTEFAPFGMATVSRTVQPQLPEYLDALSASDGADPYLAAKWGSDPTRNGEPYGELGIVLQQDAAWGDQKGKPRDPQAGNTPGVKRDVLRTSGTKVLNSPGTDPPAAPGGAVTTAPAAPVVEMAPSVSNGDQTLAPLVVRGAIGATVSYTVSSGAKSISGTGTIALNGEFSVLIDLSSLPDGTVTASATLTLSGLTSTAGTTTAVKNTVIPGAVGLALPGYVGLAGKTNAPLTLTGNPGNYVIYEIDGPTAPIISDGYFDKSTGLLVLGIDFTGYPDGVYTVSAVQYDKFGNASVVGLSTPTLTLDTVVPAGSFTVNAAPSNTALTNNPAISLAVSFTDDRSGVNQVRVSVDNGITWSAWQPYAATLSATLPSPDATYTVVVQVADKSGNIGSATQKAILDRTGPTITDSLSTPNNGTFYDVGTPITLIWAATDLNGVKISSATIEGQTISSSGGTIDVDVLTAGTHTVTITATDKAGNTTISSLTFTIHATPQGLINAVNDGLARGWITKAYASTLVTQLQQVIKGLQSSTANGKAKLQQFISYVQYPTKNALTPAFQTLLLSWGNDLYSRM